MTIYIDEVAHSARKSLVYLFAALGDFEPDGDVDIVDFAMLAEKWLLNSGSGSFEFLYDLSYPYDDTIDILDLEVFADNWMEGVH